MKPLGELPSMNTVMRHQIDCLIAGLNDLTMSRAARFCALRVSRCAAQRGQDK
jgi:hypothetical protein